MQSGSSSSSCSPSSVLGFTIPDLQAAPGINGSFKFVEPRLRVEQMTDSSATDSDSSSSPTYDAEAAFKALKSSNSSGYPETWNWNPWTGRDFDLREVLGGLRKPNGTTTPHWLSSHFTHGQHSRQMADQLTVSSELHAEDYITYPANQKHSNLDLVKFYIEGGPRSSAVLPNPDCFVVNVWKPSSGGQCDVRITFDKTAHRYICSFFSDTPGLYTCNVFVGLQGIQQIRGSPLEITVGRVYSDPWLDHSLIAQMYSGSPESGRLLANTAGGWGIDVDRFTEKIFVVDRPANKIRVLCKAGKQLDKFGHRGTGPGEFYRPTSIAIDDVNMRILVTDRGNHRVCMFTLQGYHHITSFGELGNGDGQFCCPWGVAVSPNGNFIAVGDGQNNRIQLFDKDGTFLFKICLLDEGAITLNEFKHPRGICFDRTGKYIYASDSDNGNVFKINIQMTEKVPLLRPGILKQPQGLCLDFSGNIVIADSGLNCIRVISPDGAPVITLQDSPERPLDYPLDVAMMRQSQIVFVNSKGYVRMC